MPTVAAFDISALGKKPTRHIRVTCALHSRVRSWPVATPFVSFQTPLLPFSLRVSGCFPAGAAVGTIATMNDRSLLHVRQGLLDDLASTRTDLLEINACILRKLGHARSVQWIAATSGFSAVTFMDTSDDGTPISPAQLASSIKQFESQAVHIRELLAHVDARLAEVSPEERLSAHRAGRWMSVFQEYLRRAQIPAFVRALRQGNNGSRRH